MRHRWTVLLAVLAWTGCGRPPEADVGFVTEWTRTHFALLRAERLSPPVASRLTAYVAIALYQGWATGSDSLRSLVGQLNGLDSLPAPDPGLPVDRALVALESQTTVLRALVQGGFASTIVQIDHVHDSLIAVRTTSGISDQVRDRSLAYGAKLGAAIAKWAAEDGFGQRQLAFTPGGRPESWVPTATEAQYRPQNLSAQSDVVILDNPAGKGGSGALSGDRSLTMNRPKAANATNTPGINPVVALEPGWGDLRHLALAGNTQCPAPPPVPFSTRPGSPFYLEAKAIYDLGRNLTPEQKQIAYFWADNPGESGTPAGHWMSVVAGLAEQWKLSPERAVEAYAMTAIAVAEGFMGAFHEKYATDLLRPVTYINRYIDSRWQSLLITPPFPTFTSAHSTQSAAAAQVLIALFGNDRPYDDPTHVPLGHPIKRLPSFEAAADEAGHSRWYGGIHYPMDHVSGKVQGACIGKAVLARVKTRS